MSSDVPTSGSRSWARAGVIAALWLMPAWVVAEPDSETPDAPTREAPIGAGRSETSEAPVGATVPEGTSEGAPPAALPAPAAAPETPQVRQARELTARGRERFEAGDFRAALIEFSGAYELLEDNPRRAALLNNIAVCHERMFRYDLALHYYERYLHEGSPDAADRKEVEAVIRGLRGLLGTLRITANVSSEIWIDDRPYGALSRELLVPAGPHVIELRAPAHESARREVRVIPRAAQSLHFDLQPLPEYRGLKRAYFWSGVGLTSAALITGGALGLRALSVEKDAQAVNRQDLATIEHEQRYKNLALASDLAFGTAALFAVGSTVLFFLTDWGGGGARGTCCPARRPFVVRADSRARFDNRRGPRRLAMTKTSTLLATGLVAVISACSLVVQELSLHCDEPSDCDPLNEKYGLNPMEDCSIYQCRSDRRGCEKRPQDLDGDGFTPQVCHDEQDDDVDCDDSWVSGTESHPMQKEECDGIDNNCDGQIDEGLALGVVQEQHEKLPGTITDLSATPLSDGRGFVIASVQRTSPAAPATPLREIWAVILDPERKPAAKLVTADGFEGKNCGPNLASGSAAKCAFSGATAFASREGLFTAATESAGCSGTARVLFGLEPDAVANESPATWGWGQASSTLGPLAVEPDAAACQPGARVALAGTRPASNESSVLAVWWNPESSGLALASLTSHGNSLVVEQPSGAAFSLPATSVNHAPALVALPGRGSSYLLAYATGDAAACAGINVARVTVNSSGSPVLTQTTCLGAAGADRPVLAVASRQEEAAQDGDPLVGLAWLDRDGAISFTTLHIGQEGDALEATNPRLATTAPADALSMAWLPEPEGTGTNGRWLLTWRGSCGATACLYGALLGAHDDASTSVPFRIADLNGPRRPLTVIQPTRQALALVRAESTSLDIGFLGCIDSEP